MEREHINFFFSALFIMWCYHIIDFTESPDLHHSVLIILFLSYVKSVIGLMFFNFWQFKKRIFK